MRNLTEQFRKDPSVSLTDKLKLARPPRYLLAENMGDFLANRAEIAETLSFLYRALSFFDPYVLIYIYNVAIDSIPGVSRFVNVHDDTGGKIMMWGQFPELGCFSTWVDPDDYEYVEHTPGVETLHAYRMTFLYQVNSDLCAILDLDQNPRKRHPIQEGVSERAISIDILDLLGLGRRQGWKPQLT